MAPCHLLAQPGAGWAALSPPRRCPLTCRRGAAARLRPRALLRTSRAASARELLLACIIAPLGAWLRYLLGFNNKNTPSFPVYTYLANMIGSVISILIYALLSKALPAGDLGKLGGRPAMLQEWLLAISLGFCGTFTTVSSFVHEVHVLWRERTLVDAYTYTLTTLVSIHAICLGFLLPFAVHYSTCERSPGLSNYDDETAMMSMD